MARAAILPLFFITTVVISSLAVSTAEGFDQVKKNGRPLKKKLSRFTVYWQDILSGPRPTAVTVVKPPQKAPQSRTEFGMVRMIDNPLTRRKAVNSSVVGRAQGLYASASQSELCFMMAMNFAFTSGKYSGSSLTLLGPNHALSQVRELPVVGGTGLFRWARGYAILTTMWLDEKSGDATVQYNITVMHY